MGSTGGVGSTTAHTSHTSHTSRSRIYSTHEFRLLIFLIVCCIGLGWVRPGFLHPTNLRDVVVNAAPVLIAAAGMTIVIVSGGIDISIGSLFGACAIAAGVAAKAGWPIAVAVVIPVLLGAAVGAVNGLMITLARIPPIIATLGMLSIIRGVTIYLTGGNEVRDLPETFRAVSLNAWLGIPNPAIFAVVVVGAAMLFLSMTKPGREIYAVGGNVTAATLAAIRVTRLRLLTYSLGGLCVGIAALVHAARLPSTQPTTGAGLELVVITAVVLGGTSILGGKGKVLGSALGAVVLEVIPNALTFLRVPYYWKEAALGAVVLLAVLSSASARRETQGRT